MFYSPRLYFKDKRIFVPIIGVFLAQIFSWWYILSNIRPSSDQFFLHYNITFGVDLAGEWWKILYLPLSGILVLLINVILSFYFYNAEKFLSGLLILLALLFNIFLVIAVFLIVNLNI